MFFNGLFFQSRWSIFTIRSLIVDKFHLRFVRLYFLNLRLIHINCPQIIKIFTMNEILNILQTHGSFILHKCSYLFYSIINQNFRQGSKRHKQFFYIIQFNCSLSYAIDFRFEINYKHSCLRIPRTFCRRFGKVLHSF